MERNVDFYSGAGIRLSGILETPAGLKANAKLPAIVLCCGPGRGKGFLVPSVSNYLARRGYAVLRFDYRGVGESEGPPNRLIPMDQVDDIRNALTFLQQQPEVDSGRIGLWGAATGGANATYVAGVDERVKCLVAVSAMSDLGEWMRVIRRYWEWVELLGQIEIDRKQRVVSGQSKLLLSEQVIIHDPETAHERTRLVVNEPEFQKPLRISLQSVEAIINFRPIDVVGAISPRAAMWVCCGKDTLVPTDFSRALYERCKEPRKLVVMEGIVHHAIYRGRPFQEMMGSATGWFNTHLRDGS